VAAVVGCCVAPASDIPPPHEANRELSRTERFAVCGQVDLYVVASSALEFKPEDERLWAPALQLGIKVVERADLVGDRVPQGPTRAQNFESYKNAANPEVIRTASKYTRPKVDGRGREI